MAGKPDPDPRPPSTPAPDLQGSRLEEQIAAKLSAVSRRAGEFCAELDEVHRLLQAGTEELFHRRSELERAAGGITRRTEELQKKATALAETEASLKGRVHTLKVKKDALVQEEEELRARDAALAVRRQEFEKRSANLDKFEAELRERHAVLEAVQDEIDRRRAILDREERRLNEREAPLAARAQEFQRRREALAREAGALLRREAELAARTREVERRRETLVRGCKLPARGDSTPDHDQAHTNQSAELTSRAEDDLSRHETELEARARGYAEQWSELEADFRALEERIAGAAHRASEAVAEAGGAPTAAAPAPEATNQDPRPTRHPELELADAEKLAAEALSESPLGGPSPADESGQKAGTSPGGDVLDEGEVDESSPRARAKRRWWGS